MDCSIHDRCSVILLVRHPGEVRRLVNARFSFNCRVGCNCRSRVSRHSVETGTSAITICHSARRNHALPTLFPTSNCDPVPFYPLLPHVTVRLEACGIPDRGGIEVLKTQLAKDASEPIDASAGRSMRFTKPCY